MGNMGFREAYSGKKGYNKMDLDSNSDDNLWITFLIVYVGNTFMTCLPVVFLPPHPLTITLAPK